MPAFLPQASRSAAVAGETAPIVSACGRSSAAAALAAGLTLAPVGAILKGAA